MKTPAAQQAIRRLLTCPSSPGVGYDYAASANPPVLHRKETFLLADDPRRGKFERLTRQEEKAGLLDETATIGTRAGWAERLRQRGYALRGHRLVRDRANGPRSGDAAE